MSQEPDYYAELGVPPGAPADDIKRAYRKLALDVHPDRGGSERRMRRLNEAWATLGDPEARRAYDAARRESAPAPKEKTIQRRPPRIEESPLIRLAGWLAGKIAFVVGRVLRLLVRRR
jgi:curved DNA-binding protein CbpA